MNNKKFKLIVMLINAGFETEGKISNLDLQSALNIPGITISDLKNIIELQTAIKKKTLFTWLFGEPSVKNKKSETQSNTPDVTFDSDPDISEET